MPELPDLTLSKWALRYFFNDGFLPIIIYGELRAGKSAYAMKALIGVLQYLFGWKITYQRIKKWWGFHPAEVIETWLNNEKKQPFYVWDDAGFWLHAMDWHDPLLITIQKYLNVIGTDYGCLVLTTPDPSWVLSKFSTLHGMVRVKIVRAKGSEHIDSDPAPSVKFARMAIGYKPWTSPDFKKHGVNKKWEDRFSCRIPDDIYSEYQPEREHYAHMAKEMMHKALLDKQKLLNLEDLRLDRRINQEVDKKKKRMKKKAEAVDKVNSAMVPDIELEVRI